MKRTRALHLGSLITLEKAGNRRGDAEGSLEDMSYVQSYVEFDHGRRCGDRGCPAPNRVMPHPTLAWAS